MNRYLRFFVASLLIFAGPLFAHPTSADAPSSSTRAADPVLVRALDDATSTLIGAAHSHAASASDLVAVARSRHHALERLIDEDPAAVLRARLPADVRATLPPDVAPYLEEDADDEGELEVIHVDHIDPTLDRYEFHLTTARERLSLHFATDTPKLPSGTRIHVRGVKVGSALALDNSNVTVIASLTPLANTLGAQNTLAILVNFSDTPTQPFTVATAQSTLFTTTSNYDYEASYQQTWLTGAVAGWYTIASTSTTCDYTTIATQAKQKATAAGYVLSNYRRLVYVFPTNACGWWGLGTVGGNPSQAWIHTKWGFTLPVVGHEMGHNLGLYHSHSLDCGSVAVAPSGCTTSEYGDTLDIMGNSGYTAHYNAFQKERLGWLNAGVSPPVITVSPQTGTRTFSIAPLERGRDGIARALKIARTNSCSTSPQEWFYVEARQAIGFDAFLAGRTNVLTGVVVHKVTEGNADSSYLLDMTPATSSWSDPGIVAGQSFVDSASGLTITPISVGTSGATISVTYGATSGCTAVQHVAPTVTYAPTGMRWTTVGLAVAYTVTVKNNDTAGTASTFDITATVPSGWTAPAVRTASIAPGSSGTASLVVTPSATAVAGYYTVTIKAANTAAPSVVATTSSTVAIASALAVTATMNQTSYTRPTTTGAVTYARVMTKVTSNSAAVPGIAVSVQVRDPLGAITTLTGLADSSGTSYLYYPVRSTSAPGSYAVTSKATLGSLSNTATTSFPVQ